ncbi:MAG: PSD1 and planctomycete cytochrome C domain-containing protein [Pirellulales bacterium]|nr:PSD1 and planctomycete cytochrome C domain-containing protein [Pirellulales bacterium]
MRYRNLYTYILTALLVSVAHQRSACGQDGEDPLDVSYEKQVLPIIKAKCFRCHGSKKQEGGLRLDLAESWLAGGDSGPAIVSGNIEENTLFQRLITSDKSSRMPLDAARLNDSELQLIRKWITEGAQGLVDVDDEEHWAFGAITRPDIPTSENFPSTHSIVDSFTTSVAHEVNRELAPSASASTLIRRLHFDLTGLPPTPEAVDSFNADFTEQDYEQLVDKLLASPAFGERWGRHWLDLARYADSTGYESDRPRQIWHYRDWVISSFNSDRPISEFILHQLAGDLLHNATPDMHIATGFHCNAMKDPGVRHEAVFDRVNTTGAVLLGLTLECAQCHDHKTDPLTQSEYYQLYAFFNTSDAVPFDLSDEATRQANAEVDNKIADVDKSLITLKEEITNTLDALIANRIKQPEGIPEGLIAIFNIPSAERSKSEINQLVTFFEKESPRFESLTEEKKQLEATRITPTTSLALRFGQRPTHLFIRGNHTQPGDEVIASAPSFLNDWTVPDGNHGSRIDLSNWITSPANPLFARVTANRIWMRLFGDPICEPENDLGIQTARPTHAKLLDYLASRLLETDSFKSIIREIVTSSTYKQSSAAKYRKGVPTGHFIGQQRLRLEAELLRDNALAASGLLVNKIGGPGVFPHQQDGILQNRATPATWTVSEVADRLRRGMYTYIWRLTPHPMVTIFDGPEMTTACTRRSRSTVAIQSLALLNDPVFVECAQALARRLLTSHETDAQRIEWMFKSCLGRNPSIDEAATIQELLEEHTELYRLNEEHIEFAIGEYNVQGMDATRHAAWVATCRTVLNLDEFITRE